MIIVVMTVIAHIERDGRVGIGRRQRANIGGTGAVRIAVTVTTIVVAKEAFAVVRRHDGWFVG